MTLPLPFKDNLAALASCEGSWLRIALSRSVVRRAFGYAVVVGAILVLINHADALLRGELSAGRLGRILLTVVVPYLVSTSSSVSAMRQAVRVPGAGAQAARKVRPRGHDSRGRTVPKEGVHGSECRSDDGYCR